MLIDFSKIDIKEKVSDADTTDIVISSDLAIGHLNKSVKPKLVSNCGFQFVSNGHWSMHQLLQVMLAVSGPADVYISSYAFSELPARAIAECKENGLIRQLNCIIDNRIDVRSAGALQLIKNTADKLKLCATHAKVTVVNNDTFHFIVISSANYTVNKRYESGIIAESNDVAMWNIKWIMDEINRFD